MASRRRLSICGRLVNLETMKPGQFAMIPAVAAASVR
jgi:hypothetical protein